MEKLYIISANKDKALAMAGLAGLSSDQVIVNDDLDAIKYYIGDPGCYTICEEFPADIIEMRELLREKGFTQLPPLNLLSSWAKSLVDQINSLNLITPNMQVTFPAYKRKLADILESCNITRENGFEYEVLVIDGQLKIKPLTHKMKVVVTLMNSTIYAT